MTDFPSRRIEAAGWRLSAMALRNLSLPGVSETTASELWQIRQRALYPCAMVKLAKRLWARGHTIDGATQHDYEGGTNVVV